MIQHQQRASNIPSPVLPGERYKASHLTTYHWPATQSCSPCSCHWPATQSCSPCSCHWPATQSCS
ncbi:hypothetical protein J4Q44_G00343420, partial [Coregonus suidteri]